MPMPQHPRDKAPDTAKDLAKAFALRVDRAAGDLNPLLTALAIGLTVLNLTLYLGIAAVKDNLSASSARTTSNVHVSAPATSDPAEPISGR
jgi:hypothetical protein